MPAEIYSKSIVEKETLDYFNNDDLATQVWMGKYALQNQNGEFEEKTPDDTHKRLAREFARIEQKYPNPLSENTIYELIKQFKYIVPQGSPMEGIGNDHRIQSLSNCFVISGATDSYGGILKTDQEQAQLMKRRGGVGHDLSNIRPKGVNTKNAAKTSDGIAAFMERYSNTTREVAQNGRRGALMLTISSKHYEVETFIDIKQNLGKVTGANISVKIDDELMKAVKNDEMYTLQWPINSKTPVVSKQVRAKDLWDKIINSAWESAEPGVLFWDTAQKYTPSDIYKDYGFESISTNPCIAGDSLIHTSNGLIKIADIVTKFKAGESIKVLTYNENSKELEYNTVLDAMLTKTNTNVIEIEDEMGETLKLTPDHKVFTETRGWVEASKLLNTDVILKV